MPPHDHRQRLATNCNAGASIPTHPENMGQQSEFARLRHRRQGRPPRSKLMPRYILMTAPAATSGATASTSRRAIKPGSPPSRPPCGSTLRCTRQAAPIRNPVARPARDLRRLLRRHLGGRAPPPVRHHGRPHGGRMKLAALTSRAVAAACEESPGEAEIPDLPGHRIGRDE